MKRKPINRRLDESQSISNTSRSNTDVVDDNLRINQGQTEYYINIEISLSVRYLTDLFVINSRQ